MLDDGVRGCLVTFAGPVQFFEQMVGAFLLMPGAFLFVLGAFLLMSGAFLFVLGAFLLMPGAFPFVLGQLFCVFRFGFGDLGLDPGFLDFGFRSFGALPFPLGTLALFLKSAVFQKSDYHDDCS